jgi:hypothetical protein
MRDIDIWRMRGEGGASGISLHDGSIIECGPKFFHITKILRKIFIKLC